MKQNYDVIIIGAGPSGSTLAYLLKKQGLSVLVIDKSVFPREKLCGGLVTMKTKLLYEEIYQKKFCSYQTKTDKVCLYYKDQLISDTSVEKPFYFVERKEFDNSLLNKFKEINGVVYEGINSFSVLYGKNEVVIGDERLKYKFLIGADGANSIIRKYIDKNYSPDALCLETRGYNQSYLKDNKIKIFFGNVNCGYEWIFPKKKFLTIGIGGTMSQNKIENQNMKQDLVNILNYNHIQKYETIKGALLPYGKYIEIPFKQNVALIGDAAGLVDPIAGEGLYFALLSAKLLCNHILNLLSHNNYLFNNTTSQCYEYIHNQIDISAKIQKRLFNPKFLKFALFKIKGHGHIVQYICDNCISAYNIPPNKVLFYYLKFKLNKKS